MHAVFLNASFAKRGALALAVLAAAIFAVGFSATQTDAQTATVSAGGPYQATAGQPIQLTGTSYLPAITAARWSFSDGTIADGLAVTKTFYASGSYTATLTVTDAAGYTYSSSTTVTVLSSTVSVASGYVLINGQLVPVSSLSGLTGHPAWWTGAITSDGTVVIGGQVYPGQTFVPCDQQRYSPYSFICSLP